MSRKVLISEAWILLLTADAIFSSSRLPVSSSPDIPSSNSACAPSICGTKCLTPNDRPPFFGLDLDDPEVLPFCRYLHSVKNRDPADSLLAWL